MDLTKWLEYELEIQDEPVRLVGYSRKKKNLTDSMPAGKPATILLGRAAESSTHVPPPVLKSPANSPAKEEKGKAYYPHWKKQQPLSKQLYQLQAAAQRAAGVVE